MDFLSYFALLMLLFVILVLAYGIIAIHDIPYLIAKKRDHPHQDAIHAGGWVSLFTCMRSGLSYGSGPRPTIPSMAIWDVPSRTSPWPTARLHRVPRTRLPPCR